MMLNLTVCLGVLDVGFLVWLEGMKEEEIVDHQFVPPPSSWWVSLCLVKMEQAQVCGHPDWTCQCRWLDSISSRACVPTGTTKQGIRRARMSLRGEAGVRHVGRQSWETMPSTVFVSSSNATCSTDRSHIYILHCLHEA